MLEAGRADLVAPIVAQAQQHWLVLGTLHADWTDPQLFAIVTSITLEQWNMVQALAKGNQR